MAQTPASTRLSADAIIDEVKRPASNNNPSDFEIRC